MAANDPEKTPASLIKRGVGVAANAVTSTKTAVVRIVRGDDDTKKIEVRDLQPEPIGTAGEVIAAFRLTLDSEVDQPPPQGRRLTFGEVLYVFEMVSSMALEDELDHWDGAFSTTVQQINEIVHDVLGVDRAEMIDRSRPVSMTELIEIFALILGADVIDDELETATPHSDACMTDRVHLKPTEMNNDGVQMTRKELAGEAIRDLHWILEGADSADPNGAATTPLWAVDDKFDGDRPTPAELIERPWESDTAHQAIMGDTDTDH